MVRLFQCTAVDMNSPEVSRSPVAGSAINCIEHCPHGPGCPLQKTRVHMSINLWAELTLCPGNVAGTLSVRTYAAGDQGVLPVADVISRVQDAVKLRTAFMGT